MLANNNRDIRTIILSATYPTGVYTVKADLTVAKIVKLLTLQLEITIKAKRKFRLYLFFLRLNT